MTWKALGFSLFWLLATAAQSQPVWQSSATNIGSSGNASVSRPAGVTSGDLLIVGLMVEKGTGETITTPSGWTLIRRTNQSSNAGMATFYRVAGASEPATYTFNLANGSKWAIGISRITGADAADPIDVWSEQTGSTASTSVVAPSATTTVANTLVLAFYTNKKNATYTPAAGTTERYDVPNDAGGLPSNMMATFGQATAGATGNKTATASISEVWVAQQVAVRPVPPAPTTPQSFNVFETSTAAGAISGVIRTKVAGAAFTLDVVAIADGAQLNSFSEQVRVELVGTNTIGAPLDAENCPTSSTLLQTVSPHPTISNGRSTVTFSAVTNSWRNVRVRVRYPPTGTPVARRCSSDNFAIRPHSFTAFSVSDTDWQTAGTVRSLNDATFGSVMHKAGRPFSARANAVNAAAALTTNYTGTPTATLSACVGAACTASFGTLSLNTAFTSGQLATDIASYDNVGAFRVQLVDSTFAAVDAADGSTPGERNIVSAAIDVGRFVPDHFSVSLNTPSFAAACSTFTYIGQTFQYATAPVVTVTARDFTGNTTTLYEGAWWRISNGTLTPAAQSARYSAASGSLDPVLLPDVSSDPAVVSLGGGVGTLTFSSAGGLAFSRSTAVAPFSAEISLATEIADADGVSFAGNPARFGLASAGNGIAFSGGKAMRFGRLRVDNAVGSDKLDLPIALRTEYWTGSAFVTNADDHCTAIGPAHLALTDHFGGINAGNMNAANVAGLGGSFAAGIGDLKLTKPLPAPAAAGAVSLVIDLSAAAKSYLKGNWGVSTFTADPSARAAFGLFGTQPTQFIYFRENY